MRQLRSALGLIVAVLIAAGTFVTVGAGMASAAGQPTLSRAGDSLKRDPVYVDPNVTDTNLNTDRVNTLRAAIKKGPHPIYIAVLPASVKQEVRGPNDLPGALQQRTGLAGVYAVWTVGVFRADATQSTGVPQAGALAATSYNAHKGDVYAMLLDYVQQVQKVPVAVNSVTKEPFPWGMVLLIIGLVALLVVVIIVVVRRRGFKNRKREYERRQTNLQSAVSGLSAEAAATSAANDAQTALNSALTTLAEARTSNDLWQAKRLLDQAERLISTARRANEPAGSSWRTSGTGYSASRASTASAPYPQPAQVPTVINNYVAGQPITVGCYPGYGYGRYPSGWGYYDYSGNFVAGMLFGEMIAGRRSEVTYVDFNHSDAIYVAPERMDGDVGGGGDWRPDPIVPDTSYVPPANNTVMDGDVGGGGTWEPPAYQQPSSFDDTRYGGGDAVIGDPFGVTDVGGSDPSTDFGSGNWGGD